MKNYICIDGGTTNTRVELVKNGTVTEKVKINIGAQKSIGGNSELKSEIKKAISLLLTKYALSEADIDCVIASGMITSEYGLCKLDHLIAPVGITELHNGMKRTQIPEISNIPFVFIPGVKLNGKTLEENDMMRGEETELMGLYGGGECVYVLPGSHSKLIKTDANGRIADICSMLTGEMVAAIAVNTILKDSVDLSVTEYEAESLLSGYTYCETHGVNAALFKVRVMKNLLGASPEKTYSFFLGVVLHDEIEQIIKCKERKVVIGGKRQLRNAMCEILKKVSDKETVCLSEDEVERSTVSGMIKIYEYNEN